MWCTYSTGRPYCHNVLHCGYECHHIPTSAAFFSCWLCCLLCSLLGFVASGLREGGCCSCGICSLWHNQFGFSAVATGKLMSRMLFSALLHLCATTPSAFEFAHFIDHPSTRGILGVACSQTRCGQSAGNCNTVTEILMHCSQLPHRPVLLISSPAWAPDQIVMLSLHFGSSSVRGGTRHLDRCKVCSKCSK
jgi:hypothetical protein